MARDEEAARREVTLAMSRLQLGPTELARAADIDVKTVRNFLIHHRWPQHAKRAKIETALELPANALEDIAEGRQLSDQADDGSAPSDLAARLAEDPTLSEAARAHIVNQYRLLQQLSALEAGRSDPEPRTKKTPKGSFGTSQDTPEQGKQHRKGA